MKPSKTLIIFDYERIIPPFMQTLIKVGLGVFDEIIYITPPMPHKYTILNNHKIKSVTWSKYNRVKQYISGIFSPLRPEFWKELSKGSFSKSAFANIGKYYFCSDGFMDIADSYIKKALKNGNQVYLLATWMAVDAFTCARFKQKYPNIKAYVLAHSGEVIADRNQFMHQSFHEYIFEHVDKVYFISKKVLAGYLNSMSDIRLEDRFKDKISTVYLGCLKKDNGMNPLNESDTINLLSCSRIDDNKRLERIISSLSKWNGKKIYWTHIGTGILETYIKELAAKLMMNNHLIEINFTGRLDNSDVIEYYSNHSVDLFINVSKSEGLPISIMEAMSYGIPCAATDVGGTSEIVDKYNGFLLNQDFSDDELINVIQHFDSLSLNEKISLRTNAYHTWLTKFNASINANHLFGEWLEI